MSVATSTMGSSAETWSPTATSHEVIVPSVTDSPSAGIATSVISPLGAAAGAAAAGAGASGAGASGAGAGAATGSVGETPPPAAASSGEPMRARSAPTSTVSSSSTRISSRTPAAGEGTSESTLSVATSTIGSSTSTVSPTCLSHVVTVPSVTDSPSAGIFRNCAIFIKSPLSVSLSCVRAEACRPAPWLPHRWPHSASGAHESGMPHRQHRLPIRQSVRPRQSVH